MQIRSFKLPPLPGKKSPPIQVMKRLNRVFQQQVKTPCSFSRQKKGYSKEENKQNQGSNRYLTPKRPSSVRSYSQKSIQSRGSSRQRSSQASKDQINHSLKTRVSMPLVTAKSWAVYQMKQNKMIYGKRMFKSKEIASLTKIMNLLTILQIIQQFKLAPAKIKIKISRQSCLIIGTSAQLQQNYVLSLYDLYFGMMLPSGNDAANQIAQIGGALLLMQRNQGQVDKNIAYNYQLMSQFCKNHCNITVTLFINHMNKISKRLEMMNSKFANSHGLSNPQNFSCAEDLCKLCCYCMQNQIFRNVVKTQIYSAQYFHQRQLQQTSIDCQGNQFVKKFIQIDRGTLTWQNTNKMLKQGWSGIKTGITPNAGPCLAASIEKYINGRNLQFLVILIDSVSMQSRWKQVRQIVNWVISQKIYF